jgi:hypothetical protein
VSKPQLHIATDGTVITITWEGTGYTPQQAADLNSDESWSDLPGPITASPFCVTNPPSTTFFRLRN